MTLNITSNQIEVKNSAGTTKFTGDDKLLYLRYVQSGTVSRVPNLPNGNPWEVWTQYFDPIVTVPLSTTIDSDKDVIQLTGSISEVQDANYVASYSGFTVPFNTPLLVDIKAVRRLSTEVQTRTSYLTVAACVDSLKFGLQVNCLQWQNSIISSSDKTAAAHTFCNTNAPDQREPDYISPNPIVGVSWQLNVWRYQN